MTPLDQFLVVHVEWDEPDGTARQEIYGPWAVADDDSHLAAVSEFVRAWPERSGVQPETVTLVMCVDPAAWLAGETATAASAAVPATSSAGSPGFEH